jgi:hypothetical protein
VDVLIAQLQKFLLENARDFQSLVCTTQGGKREKEGEGGSEGVREKREKRVEREGERREKRARECVWERVEREVGREGH